MNLTDVDESRLRALAEAAWRVRDRARVHGPTRVGVALFTSQGDMYVGCNVEHRFRSHDVHAEVNALTNMVAGGGEQAAVLVVAAERDNFTPCGSCLDWIFPDHGDDRRRTYATLSALIADTQNVPASGVLWPVSQERARSGSIRSHQLEIR